ncbi:MAG: hypothetical protein R3F56_00945 [Planctomycetota bacterium]
MSRSTAGGPGERPEERLDERFADWVDGRLGPAERAALEAEMARDPGLRRAADEYRQGVQMLRSALTPEDMGPSVASAVMAQVRPTARPPRAWRPYLASLIAAAALVLVFVTVRSIPPAGEPSQQDVATGSTTAPGDSFFVQELKQVGRAADDQAPAQNRRSEAGAEYADRLAKEEGEPAPPAVAAPPTVLRMDVAQKEAEESDMATLRERADAAGEEVKRARAAVGAEVGLGAEVRPDAEAPRDAKDDVARRQPSGDVPGERRPKRRFEAQADGGARDDLQAGVGQDGMLMFDTPTPGGALGEVALVVEVAPAEPRAWRELDARTAQADGNVAELLAVLAPPLEESLADKVSIDFRSLALSRVTNSDLGSPATQPRTTQPPATQRPAFDEASDLGDEREKDEREKKVGPVVESRRKESASPLFAVADTDRVYRVRGTRTELRGLVSALQARARGEVRFERLAVALARLGPSGGADAGALVGGGAGSAGPVPVRTPPAGPTSPGPTSSGSTEPGPTNPGPTNPGPTSPGPGFGRVDGGVPPAGRAGPTAGPAPGAPAPGGRGGESVSPRARAAGTEKHDLLLVLRPARARR